MFLPNSQFLYPYRRLGHQALPYLVFSVSPVWKLCFLETLGSSLSTVEQKRNSKLYVQNMHDTSDYFR